MAQNKNEYYGYSLFKDTPDADLRARNRATTLKNIMEDNLSDKGELTAKAGLITMGYFNLIREDERKAVYDNLESYFDQKRKVNV